MARKDKDGNWLNPRGHAVDPAVIGPIEKKRDRMVEQIYRSAERLEAKMKAEKLKYLEKIMDYVEYLEAKMKGKCAGGGNMVLTNYSGDRQIQIKINDVIQFDEKLSIAKHLIDEWVVNESSSASADLKAFVTQAFEVDKTGQINKYNIIRLMRLNIKNKQWRHAMDVLQQSIDVTGTRQYLNIRRRNESGKWEAINMNFSSM